MSLSVVVEIGSGDRRLKDAEVNTAIDYNTLVRYGKKAIYDTRPYNEMTFSALYKPVFPNDVVMINDKILGKKKAIVHEHKINIQGGLVRSEYTVRCDYE